MVPLQDDGRANAAANRAETVLLLAIGMYKLYEQGHQKAMKTGGRLFQQNKCSCKKGGTFASPSMRIPLGGNSSRKENVREAGQP